MLSHDVYSYKSHIQGNCEVQENQKIREKNILYLFLRLLKFILLLNTLKSTACPLFTLYI